jgi:hypothetical protein
MPKISFLVGSVEYFKCLNNIEDKYKYDYINLVDLIKNN